MKGPRGKAIDPLKCDHTWISNSGAGGAPVFRVYDSGPKRMHVKCEHCNSRAWMTEDEWNLLPALNSYFRNCFLMKDERINRSEECICKPAFEGYEVPFAVDPNCPEHAYKYRQLI